MDVRNALSVRSRGRGGPRIKCKVGATALDVEDAGLQALNDGGVALVIAEGALSSNEIRISPT
jgi:hypothetical protein